MNRLLPFEWIAAVRFLHDGRMQSALIVIGVARLIMMLALFLLFERLSGSSRVAGLAALVYCASPNFLFWSSQYSYQSLALPLAVLTFLGGFIPIIGAFVAGAVAVLVALGTMSLGGMLALSVLIFLEKIAPGGERIAILGAVVFALAGMALLFDPGLLTYLN